MGVPIPKHYTCCPGTRQHSPVLLPIQAHPDTAGGGAEGQGQSQAVSRWRQMLSPHPGSAQAPTEKEKPDPVPRKSRCLRLRTRWGSFVHPIAGLTIWFPERHRGSKRTTRQNILNTTSRKCKSLCPLSYVHFRVSLPRLRAECWQRRSKGEGTGPWGKARRQSRKGSENGDIVPKINCQVLGFLFLWKEVPTFFSPGSQCSTCAQYQAQGLWE